MGGARRKIGGKRGMCTCIAILGPISVVPRLEERDGGPNSRRDSPDSQTDMASGSAGLNAVMRNVPPCASVEADRKIFEIDLGVDAARGKAG